MRELLKTSGFVAAAAALVIVASLVEPDRIAPGILSDQGELFYPKFTDPQAVRTIEVVDYDEETATARPFQVAFERGRWTLPSHHNYPVEAGERLAKTAAALMDLRKDQVRSDSPSEHGRYGVIDPLDPAVPELTGRGKRVTLRDERKDVLADFILGKPVEGREGERYVRVPGQKRTYLVKTEADPSARFSDWVDTVPLRISGSAIRKLTIHRYSVDERIGAVGGVETLSLAQEGGRWTMEGGGRVNAAAAKAIAAVLGSLRMIDVRPKPPGLAQDLKQGQVEMTLENALSLRQRGFFLSPNGRLLASDGEMVVETANGLAYVLRFGELAAAGGENRFLFVTVSYDAARAARYGDTSGAGERLARDLSNRFAEWYYVVSGADLAKLRPKRGDLAR